jgi:integrase
MTEQISEKEINERCRLNNVSAKQMMILRRKIDFSKSEESLKYRVCKALYFEGRKGLKEGKNINDDDAVPYSAEEMWAKATTSQKRQISRFVRVGKMLTGLGVSCTNMSEAVEKYRENRRHIGKGVQPKRIDFCCDTFKEFAKVININMIEETTRDHVIKYKEWMESKDMMHDTQVLKLSAVKAVYMFLQRAERYKIDTQDIFWKMIPGVEGTKKEKYITQNQIVTLLNSITDPDWNFFFKILYNSWLRSEEIRTMKVKDVDTETPILHVPYSSTSKQHDKRDIVIDQNLWLQTKQRIQGKEYDSPLFMLPCNGDDSLKCPTYDDIRLQLKKYCENSGIYLKDGSVLTPHTFRHCAITHAKENGMPIESIQRRAGHKQLTTTTRSYLHIQSAQMIDEEQKTSNMQIFNKQEAENGV